MAVGFTPEEKERILILLKQEAKICVSSIGMRKTTVDRLAQAAGISKGAFYKFFESKELLFLEVLEDWHKEIYDTALSVIQRLQGLPQAERAAQGLLAAFRIIVSHSLTEFLVADTPFLLRKIPKEIVLKRYHSDAVHLRYIISVSGLRLKTSEELAVTVIVTLMQALKGREADDDLFWQSYELIVRGACSRLF